MALWIFIAVQFAASALGLALLWRRQRTMSAEIARLQASLAALEAAPSRVRTGARVSGGAVVVSHPAVANLRPAPPSKPASVRVPEDVARGLVLALAAAAPSLVLAQAGQPALAAGAGIIIAALMMTLSLRKDWRAAAWAGAATALCWAVAGAFLSPGSLMFNASMAIGGVVALSHACARPPAAGAVMAATLAAVALLIAARTGMISPAGACFSAIVAAAALVGARALRTEALHVAAFAAALAGLFVLSGQEDGAIWFTPTAALFGAVFLAIAAVRTPQLGAHGAVIAGIGAMAPLLATAALQRAGHGLAEPWIAAIMFALLATMLSGVIFASARRDGRGVAKLGLTLWVLALGAFAAAAAAIGTGFPAPVAAPAYAGLALGLAALRQRLGHRIWSVLTIAAVVMVVSSAAASARMALLETPRWSPWALTGVGLAAPALALTAAARLGRHAGAAVAGFGAALLAVASANLAIRVAFADGAVMLNPVGFAEAGIHIAVWLGASLLIAGADARSRTRAAIALTLGACALAASALCAVLWFTPFWTEGGALHAPLGFLAPALLYWAQWALWRQRGALVPARCAFSAAALSSAAFVSFETLLARGGPDWATAVATATAFALAVAANFAGGVTKLPEIEFAPAPARQPAQVIEPRKESLKRRGVAGSR